MEAERINQIASNALGPGQRVAELRSIFDFEGKEKRLTEVERS